MVISISFNTFIFKISALFHPIDNTAISVHGILQHSRDANIKTVFIVIVELNELKKIAANTTVFKGTIVPLTPGAAPIRGILDISEGVSAKFTADTASSSGAVPGYFFQLIL